MKFAGALLSSISFLLLAGCGMPGKMTASVHRPELFRSTLERMIRAKEYREAVEYLRKADPVAQAAFDKTGYLAVGEDMITLPGAPSGIRYERSRDWFIPGTSDVIENPEWQWTAKGFASVYNRRR